MQLQTFKAQTMAECLSQVKTSMGSDAIILHTRTYQAKQWLGLRRREVVEITAGKGINIGRRKRSGPEAEPPPGKPGEPRPRGNGRINEHVDDAAGVSTGNGDRRSGRPGQPSNGPANPLAASDRAMGGTYGRPLPRRPLNGEEGVGTSPAAESSQPPRHLLDTPAATSAAVIGLTQEVTTVKQMLKELLEKSRGRDLPDLPEPLRDHYELLVQNQFSPAAAEDMVRSVQRQVRPENLDQSDLVRARLADFVEKQIPLGGPIAPSGRKGRPTVVALVGPTGVGKTTTLAKLAAKLKLEQGHRVGLITLDTYRIAAVDQLRRYAEILQSPLKVVRTAEELQEALESMQGLDYVLIDTAGRSPKDRLKINELKNVLEVAQADEVHLVLSTTANESSLQLAVKQFDQVRVDRLIFTKLDEAASLGFVPSLVRTVNKSVSYITTGQDVPDDIEVAKGPRLARLILGEEL